MTWSQQLVKYILPRYKRGNKYLIRACIMSHPLTWWQKLTINYCDPAPKITYGYLGLIASKCLAPIIQPQRDLLSMVFALDHVYAPLQLKHYSYRLANLRSGYQTVDFGQDGFLNVKSKNLIYQYLKDVQALPMVSLYGKLRPTSGLHSQYINLIFRGSQVVTLLHNKATACAPGENRLESFQGFCSPGHPSFITYKKHEARLARDACSSKHLNQGKSLQFYYKDILEVYCPTSMAAIDYMLHSIPVTLSSAHPMRRYFGIRIPALSRDDALDSTYNAIIRSSFSMNRISEVENYLAQS